MNTMLWIAGIYSFGFLFTFGFFDNIKMKDGKPFGRGYAFLAAFIWPIIWPIVFGMALSAMNNK